MSLFKTRFTGMEQVWLLLHFFELTMTIMSFVFHVKGAFDQPEEPFQHTVFCCGVFFVFLIYEFIDVTRILTGGYASYLFMFLVEMIATCSFYVSAIISMHFAELDIHLQYIDAVQEDNHPFFKYSKAQSATSICASSIHLLHCCLLADVYVSYNLLTSRPVEEFSRRKAFVSEKKRSRLTIDEYNINPSLVLADRAIILALCHQRFEPLIVLQETLKTCCKGIDRRSLGFSLIDNQSSTRSFQSGGSSVRFTQSFYWIFDNKFEKFHQKLLVCFLFSASYYISFHSAKLEQRLQSGSKFRI